MQLLFLMGSEFWLSVDKVFDDDFGVFAAFKQWFFYSISENLHTRTRSGSHRVYICILAIMFREAFSHRISFAWTEIEIQTAP